MATVTVIPKECTLLYRKVILIIRVNIYLGECPKITAIAK
jgi:hypothetical protein